MILLNIVMVRHTPAFAKVLHRQAIAKVCRPVKL